MKKTQAKQLHNHDQIQIRTTQGTWETGTILGEPHEQSGRILIPTITPTDGYRWIDHTDAK